VTKSGGNELHGDVFVYYQNKDLVAIDGVTQRRADANDTDAVKPEYERWQPGVSLGGPIVKDKLHFFASYEGNVQDREYEVFRGTNMNWPAAFRDQFRSTRGSTRARSARRSSSGKSRPRSPRTRTSTSPATSGTRPTSAASAPRRATRRRRT
jgi:hypothetical protein